MNHLGLRSANTLRSFARGHRPLAKQLGAPSRAAHFPVKLPYDADAGLGKFMSGNTLQLVASDYQRGLLQRLNDLIKGTPAEKQSLLNALVGFAQDRTKALEFAYAAQALNNSFFLDQLKPPPENANEGSYGHEHEIEQYERLRKMIEQQFGSVAHLKSVFSSAANGMFGTGWVWLVADSQGRLAVTATYGAGTMLVRSRENMNAPVDVLGAVVNRNEQPESSAPQELSRNLRPSSSSPLSSTLEPSSPASGASLRRPLDANQLFPSRSNSTLSATRAATNALLTNSREADVEKQSLTPLLVCSIHEHCWLGDHGVWGKEEYLENFWEVVDWKKVAAGYDRMYGARRKYGFSEKRTGITF